MKRKKQKTVTPEQMRESIKLSSLKEILNDIEIGKVSTNPTRLFKIGDEVIWGNHKQVFVREVCADGMYYLIESIGVQRTKDEIPHNELRYMAWHDLFPITDKGDSSFHTEEKYRITLSNSSIDSLIYKVYGSAGVDFDVEYQREHVWGMDEKVALIDSIFKNIDIGKFVFVRRSWNTLGKLYEVLDGKQRLTAIIEFYEDRFKYNGYYYSDLSFKDKWAFKNHGVTYGYLENPDKKSIFDAFIKLNTCGKPMDIKHIEKVKKMINEL